MEVVKVVAGSGRTGTVGLAEVTEGAPVVGCVGATETVGVISGVLVTRVLNRLGGATLFIHSVVPLTTEKKYVPRAGSDGEALMSETVMIGPGTVTYTMLQSAATVVF
jgi:hypothetical protein